MTAPFRIRTAVLILSLLLAGRGTGAGAHDPEPAPEAPPTTRAWANKSLIVDSPGGMADDLPLFFPLNQISHIGTAGTSPDDLVPATFIDAGDPGFYPTEPALPEAAIINNTGISSIDIPPAPKASERFWSRVAESFQAWTSRISLGGRSLSGNSRQNFIDLAADFEKKEELRITQINIQGQFGESNDIIVANRWFANSTTDFYHGDHWLTFVKIMDQYDALQNLDYRGTFSGGAGYRFFFEDHRRLVLRVGPGVTTEFFHSPAGNRTTPDLFGEVEIRLPVWERLKWEQKATVFPSLSALEVARAQSQTALLYAFDEQERWSLKLGFQYQFISEPNPGRLPNDYTTNLSIVYLRK